MKPILTICCCWPLLLAAQNLPPEMYLSSDGHQLFTGGQATTGLYDESVIRTIHLDFDQSNYWTLLTQNYQSHTDIPATMTVEGQVFDSVGVRFKGMTSYQQTQNKDKKSFNLSLGYATDYEKWMGYKTFNLNNCFQDASFLREFFYLHQIRRHIPAAKASFVQLYLNDEYWGIYPNVQQLNGDFYEEWFMSNNGTNWRADQPAGSTGGGPGPGGPGGGWGDGTAALNYLGTDSTEYKKYYTLKSTDKTDPWSDLIATCNVLENTPLGQLQNELSTYMDLDRTLWYLASEIAFTDDDSYVFKGKMDYYLYWEAETGRITPIEYDGNSAMETSFAQQWTPFYHANDADYPLLNRVLAVPALRQRYLAHLRTIVQEELDPVATLAALDGYAQQIAALVQADPKKLYTYTQFTSEVTELKNYITTRRNYLLNNVEMQQIAPTIATAAHYVQGQEWATPTSLEEVHVRTTVTSTNGIDHVTLFYTTGLVGNFTAATMLDDGQHDDGNAGDGVFGATIPAQAAGNWVRYYVEATSANTAKSVSYLPVGAEHDVFIYKVSPPSAGASTVVINELMASNQVTATDENGEFEDWIELYNTGSAAVDISGWYITDNPDNLDKWAFPAGTIIAPNTYLILWADEDSSQGPLHANFKLAAGGETLALLNTQLQLEDEVVFEAQEADQGYARVPNGTGPFVIQTPTFGYNNNESVGTTEENALAQMLEMVPNPADQSVRITLPAAARHPVEVFNALGQRKLSVPYTEGLTLPTADWPAGVYVLRCGDAERVLVIRH